MNFATEGQMNEKSNASRWSNSTFSGLWSWSHGLRF